MANENECLVMVTLTLDETLISNGIIIFTNILRNGEEEEYEVYKVVTGKNGTARIKIPQGEYSIHAEYTSPQTENTSMAYYTYDSTDNIFLKSQRETMDIQLYRCENEVLLNKGCKYFLHEPYMTPNNYDLYFNYRNIPVNNIIEAPHDLRRRLQRKLPLTKILHLNLETDEEPQYNIVNVHTRMTISYESYNEVKSYRVKCIWDTDLMEGILENACSEAYNSYIEALVDEENALTYEEFKEEHFTGTIEDYKVPVNVYMVRVNSEELETTFELNESNNYETYVDLNTFDENGEKLDYKVTSDSEIPYCSISFEVQNDPTIKNTVKIL